MIWIFLNISGWLGATGSSITNIYCTDCSDPCLVLSKSILLSLFKISQKHVVFIISDDSDQADYPNSLAHDTVEKLTSSKPFPQHSLTPHDLTGPSSLEALLLNIQGLLKVASEHAKQHERQVQYETGETDYIYSLTNE